MHANRLIAIAVAAVVLFFLGALIVPNLVPLRNRDPYQFEHNDSYQQKRAKVYFLSIGDKGADPSDEVLRQFSNHTPAVRKGSASTLDSRGRIVDKQTGEIGIIFRITAIRWVSDVEAEVKGGYREFPRSASWGTYTVKKERRQWTVTKHSTKREA